MYTAGRGAARLLLVAAFAVAVAGEPWKPRKRLSKVYQPSENAVRLLKDVMMNEEVWTDVLQEPIKLLDEPPYNGRRFNAPKLKPKFYKLDNIVTNVLIYDVREIVATVTTHYSNIRSFVEYGAKAVRRAMACYMFKHIKFQFRNILLLMNKNAESISVTHIAYDLKKNAITYIKLMSTVPDKDLETLLLAYWNLIEMLQFEDAQTEKKLWGSEDSIKKVNELIKNIDEEEGKYCIPYLSDYNFYRKIGIPKHLTALIEDDAIREMTSENNIVEITRMHAQYMVAVATRLKIVTMCDNLWTSLFYNHGNSSLDDIFTDKDTPSTSEASSSNTVTNDEAVTS